VETVVLVVAVKTAAQAERLHQAKVMMAAAVGVHLAYMAAAVVAVRAKQVQTALVQVAVTVVMALPQLLLEHQ
jgi:hypothetical protein